MARSPVDDMQTQLRAASKLTYEDYAAIPDDGLRHQIIDGVHLVNPAPRPRHQSVQARIVSIVLQGLEPNAVVLCAPIDVHLTEHDIVQPDVIAIARERIEIIGETKIEGPPDLAVEILSPSTRRVDRGAKRALYEEQGVREFWLADPDANVVEQLVLVDGRYEASVHRDVVRSVVFPGFELNVTDVFRGL